MPNTPADASAAAAVLLTRVPRRVGTWPRILDALLTYDNLNVCLVSLAVAIVGGHALWLLERFGAGDERKGKLQTVGYAGASEGVLHALRLMTGASAHSSEHDASPQTPPARVLALGLGAVGAATLALVVASASSRMTTAAIEPHTQWAATNALGALRARTVVCVPETPESTGARALAKSSAGSHLLIVSAADVSACIAAAGKSGSVLASGSEAAWLLRRSYKAAVSPGVGGAAETWRASAPIAVPSTTAPAFAVDEKQPSLITELNLALGRMRTKGTYEHIVNTHLCLPPRCSLFDSSGEYQDGNSIAPGPIGAACAFFIVYAILTATTYAYERFVFKADSAILHEKPHLLGCVRGAYFTGGHGSDSVKRRPKPKPAKAQPLPDMAVNVMAASSARQTAPAKQGASVGSALLSLLRELERRQDLQQDAILTGIAALMQSNVEQMARLQKLDIANLGVMKLPESVALPSVMGNKDNERDIAALEKMGQPDDEDDEDDDDDGHALTIDVEVTDEAVAATAEASTPRRESISEAAQRQAVRHAAPSAYAVPMYVGSGIGRRRSETPAYERPPSPGRMARGPPPPLPLPPTDEALLREKLNDRLKRAEEAPETARSTAEPTARSTESNGTMMTAPEDVSRTADEGAEAVNAKSEDPQTAPDNGDKSSAVNDTSANGTPEVELATVDPPKASSHVDVPAVASDDSDGDGGAGVPDQANDEANGEAPGESKS